MKLERIVNLIGCLIVACCFIFSAIRLLERFLNRTFDNRVIIRFAHFIQDDSVVRAFETVANEYMSRHPDVFVEQIVVPRNVFLTWMQTRLIGDFAPDIMPYQFPGGSLGELLQWQFLALDQYFDDPNPYNENTGLEGLPWRKTFIDAMELSGYVAYLNNFYGVLIAPNTTRLVYNRKLFEEIAGDAPIPTNFREFLQLCEKVRAFSRGREEAIMPLVVMEKMICFSSSS